MRKSLLALFGVGLLLSVSVSAQQAGEQKVGTRPLSETAIKALHQVEARPDAALYAESLRKGDEAFAKKYWSSAVVAYAQTESSAPDDAARVQAATKLLKSLAERGKGNQRLEEEQETLYVANNETLRAGHAVWERLRPLADAQPAEHRFAAWQAAARLYTVALQGKATLPTGADNRTAKLAEDTFAKLIEISNGAVRAQARLDWAELLYSRDLQENTQDRSLPARMQIWEAVAREADTPSELRYRALGSVSYYAARNNRDLARWAYEEMLRLPDRTDEQKAHVRLSWAEKELLWDKDKAHQLIEIVTKDTTLPGPLRYRGFDLLRKQIPFNAPDKAERNLVLLKQMMELPNLKGEVVLKDSVELAKLLIAKDDLAGARQILLPVTSHKDIKVNERGEAWLLIGDIYLKQNQAKAAEGMYNMVRKLSFYPESQRFAAAEAVAKLKAAEKDYAGERALWAETLAVGSWSPQLKAAAQRQIAAAAFREGNLAAALEAAKKILEADSRQRNDVLPLALSVVRDGRLSQNFAVAHEALEFAKTKLYWSGWEYHVEKGYLLAAEGKNAEARDSFVTALANNIMPANRRPAVEEALQKLPAP